MVVGEPDDAADEEAGEDGPSSSSDPTVILVENRYEEFRPRAK